MITQTRAHKHTLPFKEADVIYSQSISFCTSVFLPLNQSRPSGRASRVVTSEQAESGSLHTPVGSEAPSLSHSANLPKLIDKHGGGQNTVHWDSYNWVNIT